MRANERAYAKLLDEIQSGILAPGSVLGEVEQAARLGVSRTPLREAIGKLMADGLAVQVSPRIIVVSGIDVDAIRALFDVRRALEETGARLAAQRAAREPTTAAVFAAIRDDFAAADVADATAADAYYALIARFDAALDVASANEFLTSALQTVRTHLVRVRRLARDNPGRLTASVAEHRLIAAAIAAGDADLATDATHIHLHHALASILESVAGERTSAPHPSTQGAA